MQLSKAIQNISTFNNNKRNVQKLKISYENEEKMNYYSFDISQIWKI